MKCLGSLGLDVLLVQPFKDAFVAEHKLAQALNHAQTLQPKVLDRLLDQVQIIFADPGAIFTVVGRPSVNVHRRTLPVRPSELLALEHVQDRVDSAKRAGTSTAGGAVNDNGTAVRWLRFVR